MMAPSEPMSVALGSVTLHYVERGVGTPVVLVHGSLADLTYWEWSGVAERLAPHHRVIAYSRRYNHPNENAPVEDHSASVEAADLAEFLDRIAPEPVHLVGHSYGAFTALLYALDHPERVRTLVLGEPPLMRWLPHIPGGERFDSFLEGSWKAMGDAFRDEGDRGGLDRTSKWYFGVPFDEAPLEWRPLLARNVREWCALTTSVDAYPSIEFTRLRELGVPVLILSGERNAGSFAHPIDDQLERLLPNRERFVVPAAGHEMFLDNPEATVGAMLRHFAGH